MGWIIGKGIGVPFRLGGSGLGSSYWSQLISATVEDTAPNDFVLTFASGKPTLDVSDFTIAGFPLTGAVWAGAVLTLTSSTAVVYGDTPVITFVPSGGTANVTNNVAAEAELTTYITGLTTPLSASTLKKLNDYLKADKTALGGVATLSLVKDIDMILAGETAESSLKNLVLNDFHATAVNSPTFTAFEGFAGDGISGHVTIDYNGRTDAITYSLNNAHFGLYFRTFDRGVIDKINGVYSTEADGGIKNRIAIGVLATNKLLFALNDERAEYEDDGSTTSGYIILSRLINTELNTYINKSKNTLAIKSTKIPDQSLVIHARRTTDGSVGLYNSSQISHITLGKGLSEIEENAHVDSFETYMDSNGKGVIA